MCGIAGTTMKIDERRVSRAEALLAHRGPDGSRIEHAGDVTMIHRRLAVIDLDPRALQPLWNLNRTKAIVFNGEIYNYRDIRAELAPHTTFVTEGDSEVILAGFEAWGPEVFAKLSGMFALAIIDTTLGTVTIARDHAGMKPLYYCHNERGFTWASELSALFALTGEDPRTLLSTERIEEYFVLGYIPAPYTLYEGVAILPRGSWATFNLATGAFVMSPFVPQVEDRAITTEKAIEHAVHSHLVADVPVGLFFSGGVDSSLLAALLHKEGVNLTSYALTMPGRDADYEYGTRIAELLSLTVVRHSFDEAAMRDAYEGVTRSLDIPLADISLFPTWIISREARKDVTVVLSGEGGDELFMGYPRHKVLARGRSLPGVRRAVEMGVRAPDFSGKGTVLSSLAAMGDSWSYYITQCSPALRGLNPRTFHATREHLSMTEPLLLDREWYLENMLLRKLDAMTMAHSLEGRVPLLAPTLYMRAVDEATVFHANPHHEAKARLKRMLSEYIPRELIDRKKSGFGFDPCVLFAAVPEARADFGNAYWFLKERGIHMTIQYSEEDVWHRRPSMALAAIMLHRAVINTGK